MIRFNFKEFLRGTGLQPGVGAQVCEWLVGQGLKKYFVVYCRECDEPLKAYTDLMLVEGAHTCNRCDFYDDTYLDDIEVIFTSDTVAWEVL